MKKNKIIFGISGKAQSGKTTLARYIMSEIVKMEEFDGYDVYEINLATYLKKIMMDLFGFTFESLNDDYQKTLFSSWTWDNLPVALENQKSSGPMTNRECMEYLGAFFRILNPDAWINGLNASIDTFPDNSVIFIPDVRAPNEVKAIEDKGGYTMRLGRNPLDRDSVIEKLLDQDVYNWNEFDFIINNQNMSLEEKNNIGLKKFLKLTEYLVTGNTSHDYRAKNT